MKPVIGIPQMGNDLFRKYMKSKYVQGLTRAGAQVRWIELEDAAKAAAEILECDGLLLPGGADVSPALYGQTPSEKCGKPHLLRDAAEPKMLEAFLSTGKPILGICRGAQMMNVCLGGTLHQDIGHIATCKHADFGGKNKGTHSVTVVAGTKLAAIVGDGEGFVNSLHHQAIDTVAPDLTVSARSADGIVEAVEKSDHPFCLAVQWHPEHMCRKIVLQQKIFDAFVAACK